MAEERQFHLEIVTPDRQFFIGEAQELTVPAIDGSLGVLAGHEPAVTALEPGELRYRAGGEWHEAVVSQGLAEIMPDRVMVLVFSAERPEEIDANRARRAADRAREEMIQKRSIQEYRMAQANLARALNRLRVKGGQ